ncbi:hypothetical protein C3B58_12100 [Lactonifactor longoviformis]|nr:hypothetical protein C3B58_12100 [Lactonifactor longoviformis]
MKRAENTFREKVKQPIFISFYYIFYVYYAQFLKVFSKLANILKLLSTGFIMMIAKVIIINNDEKEIGVIW